MATQPNPLFGSATAGAEVLREGLRRRKLVGGTRLELEEFFFDPGAGSSSVHAHETDQAAYVVSGEFDVTVGGEARRVAAGDSYYVATGTTHGVRCVQQGSYILIKESGAGHDHDHDHGHPHPHPH